SFFPLKIWTPYDRQCILNSLAQLLLEKDYTLLIGRHMRPFVLDLLERNAGLVKADGKINHDRHERLSVALSKLLDVSPDALLFAKRYFKYAPPVFQRLFFTSSQSAATQYGRKRMKLRDLMEATFRYSACCLTVISNMAEVEKYIFFQKYFNSDEMLDLKIKTLEESQQLNLEKALTLANAESAFWHCEEKQKPTRCQIASDDLSKNVVAVCGVVLTKINPPESEKEIANLVLVDSTCRSLQSLAMAVASQKPVLLEGPIGSGKTVILEHLAAVTGRGKTPHFLKVQLGDQTDSKVLLQKYSSLGVVVDRLLDIYCQLTGDKHLKSNCFNNKELIPANDLVSLKLEEKSLTLEGRGLSLRDLLKWCDRIVNCSSSTSSSAALIVFLEAEHYCQMYKPQINLTETEVTMGRTTIPRKQSCVVGLSMEKQTFAATRPSLVLLEQLSVCVNRGEPVLLVGETGTGKTSTVQFLARITGHKLRVVNMNQQSDTADLLGGYKPVDHKLILLPLHEAFEDLFSQTFSRKQNTTFLGHVNTCFRERRWEDLLKLMEHVSKSAINKELHKNKQETLKDKWEALCLRLSHARHQIKCAESALLFAFVEGTLAQAVKKGEWILLDEINLAAAETLECLSSLLESHAGSLVLLDRGDTEPIVRHPEFRLFACMNPATDVGKRNLPPGIRNRFTEVYVEELEDQGDLRILILDYLKGLNLSKTIVSGIISFLTQLDRSSYPIVQKLICKHILGGNTKSLKESIPEPTDKKCFQVEDYWISRGELPPVTDSSYILTPTVKLNLRDLARVVSAG
ncbi:MDN1 protein, partial [Polypterus senegalus]